MTNLMERGILLYYYNSDKKISGVIVSNKLLIDTKDTITQYQYIPISEIEELNPTATDIFITGTSNLFVYDNYDSSMSLIFKSRTARMKFVNEIMPYIYEVGVYNDIYSSDNTEFFKKVIIKHVDFTENEYEDGIAATITFEMRGTWYWIEEQSGDTLDLNNDSSTILYIKPDDMYNDPQTDYVPYIITLSNSKDKVTLKLKVDQSFQYIGNVNLKGIYLSTDGLAYDAIGNPVYDTKGYRGIGPGRNADWFWSVDDNNSTIKGVGINAVSQLLKESKDNNETTNFQVFNRRGQLMNFKMVKKIIHNIDFI